MAKSKTEEAHVEEAHVEEAPAETVDAPPADARPVNGPGPETLGIQDLQTTAQIISICTARGAFKAEEMEQVGKIYNKLTRFIQQATEAQPAQPGQG